MTFEHYLALLTRFRAGLKLPAPNEMEITQWKAKWAGWTNKRRTAEIENINTHLIISDVARS